MSTNAPFKPTPQSIENDYMNGKTTGGFRWNGPSTDVRGRKTLSPEALAELHDAARSKKRPLTEAERIIILQKFS
jgi:hypothetical protein